MGGQLLRLEAVALEPKQQQLCWKFKQQMLLFCYSSARTYVAGLGVGLLACSFHSSPGVAAPGTSDIQHTEWHGWGLFCCVMHVPRSCSNDIAGWAAVCHAMAANAVNLTHSRWEGLVLFFGISV